MKLKVEDLKKALVWIEGNTAEVMVSVQSDGEKLYMSCIDRYQKHVEITLFKDGTMLPKIKKEDILK